MPANNLNDPLYRNRMVTNLWGGRLALDVDNMLVGPPEHKLGVTTLGATATSIPAHGVTVLNAAAASTYILDAPMTGVRKYIVQSGVGSSHNIITGTSNIKILSTFGSSQQRVALQSTGDFVQLIGLSTALWAILALNAGVSVTT
jgi:hypothetical protein